MMTVQDYLITKGIEFATENDELRTKCLFSGCDENSKHKGHLYFKQKTGQYFCHKCAESGNLITLAQFFGDDPRELGLVEGRGYLTQTRNEKNQVERILPSEIEQWHNQLPEDVRNWLVAERGISESVVADARIGWDGKHITIPIFDENGKLLFVKRRQHQKNGQGPKYLNQKGAKATIFGAERLEGVDAVVICEGELDALLLRSKGMAAVSSTGGAKTFPKEWTEHFADIPNVFIIYDNDDAGRDGARKVGEMIPHARIAVLPSEVGNGGDVTDFFKLGNTTEDFVQLLENGKTVEDLRELGNRFAPMSVPKKHMSIDEWRGIVTDCFPENLAAAEVGAAVLVQLLMHDVHNPFGLVYVDVPSSGKTITLNFFSEIDDRVYMTDSFTPASLVSHASNRKREDLESIDLLPRIRHKMLTVCDLAPMFAERQDDLVKSLGVLTRVFDGEGYESESGVHGKRGYRGDYVFMFLAASTPIAPRVWKFMGSLGARLFFLSMNSKEKSIENLAESLTKPDFKQREKRCRTATRDFVQSIWHQFPGGVQWNSRDDPRELLEVIARCSRLLARLRGVIDGDLGSNAQNHPGCVIEDPRRINTLLYNLARAHALVCGRVQLTEEDMWPVIEVTLSSTQSNRKTFFEAMMESGGQLSTQQVQMAFNNCSNVTALKAMYMFQILGLVELEKIKQVGERGRAPHIITLKEEFQWFMSDTCKNLRAMNPQSKIKQK